MWDGKERRGVDQDWVERDRMLTEVHNDVRHIADWAKKHDIDDVNRFAKVTSEIDNGKKVLWGGVGMIAFIEFFAKFLK